MRYLSLFSGIEAATVAWHPLGWTPVAYAEIEKLPCKVLAHRFPDVPNLGDVTKITELDIMRLGAIDGVIFGSPCQDLSVAGNQKGLAGERSGLFHDAMRIVRYAREWCGLRWALWENVPGAFTSNRGADFAVVVGEMGGGVVGEVPPKGWGNEGVYIGPEALVEWSTLDAQWFGVAQRRRRVFAFADFGEWPNRPPVLLEPQGVRRDSAPIRETRQSVAGTLTAYLRKNINNQSANAGLLQITFNRQSSAHYNNDDVASTLLARDGNSPSDLIEFSCKDYGADSSCDVSPVMRAMGHSGSHANGGGQIAVVVNTIVRRLTPVECERLQGFPDNWTFVDNAAAAPRYKALGNSMAVPVINWIGRSIDAALSGVWA